MAKALKKMMADAVRADLETAPNLFVFGLLPMDAEATVELRNNLRGLGASMRVIHNRSSRHALDESRQGLGEYFTGQTALTLIRGEDPDTVGIARTIVAAAKKKHLEVRGGWIDGELVDRAGVLFLSKSPDKHTLRGMIAGTILGSARGLAVSLSAVMSGLARCLQERVDKNGEQPSEQTNQPTETET